MQTSTATMRVSNNSHRTKKLLRCCLYCNLVSSFSPKTLNPSTPNSVIPSNSLIAVSSPLHSSFGPYLFGSSESNPLQKNSFGGNSTSASSFVSCFKLYSLQTKPSFGRSSLRYSSNCFHNPSLYLKNQLLFNCSGGSSSKCQFDSYSRHKKQLFCSFSSGYHSDVGSYNRKYLKSLSSLYILKNRLQCICSDSGCLHCKNLLRPFFVSCSNDLLIFSPFVEDEVQGVPSICPDQQILEKRNNFPHTFVVEIISNIKNNGEDLEAKLSMMASRLNVYSITEVFEVLNSQRVSGLRFFEWIWCNIPQLHRNANICSLVIDNLGRLDNYGTMFVVLKKFRSENICLTYEAFGFLSILASTNTSLRESTKRVVDLLNIIGGSCRNSGICSLVEMFGKLDLFEMARYVIKITESKESYYCLLIREKCRRGLVEDAHAIIREMAEAHCIPSTRVYNYLLSSLCKNGRMDEVYALLDEMNEIGCPRDAITFEILVNFVCSLGNMDTVHQVLDLMVTQGLQPRHQTHVAIVKALFAAEKYEAAHNYVTDSSVIYKTSSNMMYSIMANLYRENGDIMSARQTLVEMMEKGLKPNLRVFLKIVKQLKRAGRPNLARDLEGMHSKFVVKSMRVDCRDR